MKALSSNYDCEKPPYCRMRSGGPDLIFVSFHPQGMYYPSVCFYINSNQDLINFKNSILEAYETFRRKETLDD